MILLIGGAYHNKLLYAVKTYNLSEKDIQNGIDCLLDNVFNKKCIYNLHILIKRYMESNILTDDNYKDFIENIVSSGVEVIICDEVGSGVIPIDNFVREYRDMVGKIVSVLGNISQTVIRIYYGIPQVLKGSL